MGLDGCIVGQIGIADLERRIEEESTRDGSEGITQIRGTLAVLVLHELGEGAGVGAIGLIRSCLGRGECVELTDELARLARECGHGTGPQLHRFKSLTTLQRIQQMANPEGFQLIKIGDLSKATGFSTNTLRHWARTGQIPTYNVSARGTRWFKLSDVQDTINGRQVRNANVV